MKLRNLLFLYTRRVLTHPLQELLALVGIAVGVALVFAVQVANTSVSGSVERLARGLVGSAQLQVAARDPHGIPAELAEDIAKVPGVRTAAPVVEERVILRGPHGSRTVTLLGADQRLVSLRGSLLRDFSLSALTLRGVLPRAIALPKPTASALGVRVGSVVAVNSGTRTTRVPVALVLDKDDVGSLVDSPMAMTPISYAQDISGIPGRVTRVVIETDPSAIPAVRARLEQLVGSVANVGPADTEGRILDQATAPNNQSTALFAAISALVGLLFAFNAMLLTAPERRRFISDLRVEGLGDGTVVSLVIFDALVLGVAASCVGLVLGDQLSRHVFHASPGYLSFAFTVGTQRIIDLQSVLLAAGGGIVATLVAASRPLGDLISRRPLDAAYVADGEDERAGSCPWVAFAGLGLAVAAAILMLLAPAAAFVSFGLLLVGMLLLLPRIISGFLGVSDLLARRTRSAVLLVALGELRASSTRTLALAATGALALFGSVAIQGAHQDLQRGLDRDAHQLNAPADLWVAPGGAANTLATVPFDGRGVAARIAAVPGVRAVRTYRGAFLDVGTRRTWVVAPPNDSDAPIPPSQIEHGDRITAERRLREGGWVALSQSLVRAEHLHIGDAVTLPTPRPTPLRLAAVLTNLGWAPGSIVLNAQDFRAAWSTDDAAALEVSVAPSASAAAVATRLRAVLDAPGLAVQTAAQREAGFRASSRQGLSRLTQIATLVLVAAALALAAAMGGVVWSRRPRLAALKLSGFSDGDVWRALVLESATVLGVGCAVGALFGLCGQYALTRWLHESTGFPTSYVAAGWLAAATFAGVTVVAVAIAAVPGWIAARVPPTLSFQDH